MVKNGSIHVVIRDADGVEAHRQTHDVENVKDTIAWVSEIAPADALPTKPTRSRSKKQKATMAAGDEQPES